MKCGKNRKIWRLTGILLGIEKSMEYLLQYNIEKSDTLWNKFKLNNCSYLFGIGTLPSDPRYNKLYLNLIALHNNTIEKNKDIDKSILVLKYIHKRLTKVFLNEIKDKGYNIKSLDITKETSSEILEFDAIDDYNTEYILDFFHKKLISLSKNNL